MKISYPLSPRAHRSGSGWSDRCPAHEDQRNSLSVSLGRDGRLLLKCHAGCTFEQIISAAGLTRQDMAAMQANRSEIRSQEIRDQAAIDRRIAYAHEIWESASPIIGTIGEAYFRSRGIDHGFEVLRLHPLHRLAEDGLDYPCIIGKVEHVDAFVGIHRTYLTPDGRKRYKSMLGPCSGGAVRLRKGDGGIVVAEGIETALSAHILRNPGNVSVWAALSAGGMKGLQLPVWRTALFIHADGDEAGVTAAIHLGERAAALGWEAYTTVSPSKMDVNDELMIRKGLK